MQDRFGIIFLDGNEVIVRIYEKDAQNGWKLLRHHDRDLATFDISTTVKASDIVEVIVQVSLSRYGSRVNDWKIAARNVDEELVHEVSMVTNIQTEILTLQREQELLCKGILGEIQ